MVMTFLTSRTAIALALCIALMNLPICLKDDFLASSGGCFAGRAGCMWCE